MKKILVLIVLAFLAACGGGGGSATTEVTNTSPTGSLSINFADGAAAKAVASLPHGWVRIVITNPSLKLNGAAFKVVQDRQPGEDFSFALPLANNYVVEAVTYDKVAGENKMIPIEYAITRFVSISSPTTNSVTLTLWPVAAKLVAPGTAYQGTRVSVLANLSSAAGRTATALNSSWYMPAAKETPFIGFSNRTSAMTYSATHSFTAWNVTAPGVKMYYQAVFSLKPGLIKAGETSKMWQLGVPSAAFGNVSTAILAPVNVSFPAP